MIRLFVCAMLMLACAAPSYGAKRPKPNRDPAWLKAQGLFMKKFRLKNQEERIKAFDSLIGQDHRDVAALLLGRALTDRDEVVAETALWLLEQITDADAPGMAIKLFKSQRSIPVKARIAVLLKSMTHADIGKVCLAELKKRTTRDPRLIMMLIDALGEHRVAEAAPVIRGFLDRKGSAKFKQYGYGGQIACVRALARIADRDSVEPLIKNMKGKQGRIQYEYWNALQALTGQTLNQDVKSWEAWWKKSQASFQMDEEAVKGKDLRNSELGSKADLKYYGIPIFAKRILFVLDKSGSMGFKCVDKSRRIEGLREEMTSLIGNLDRGTLFNLLFYDKNMTPWKKLAKGRMLQPATPANKKHATTFVNAMKASGATNTEEAMDDALNTITPGGGVETLFLLSDGAPWTGGSWPDVRRIARDIRRWNRFRKVRIHTIGIFTPLPPRPGDDKNPPEKDLKDFLRKIAKWNDGSYQEVN